MPGSTVTTELDAKPLRPGVLPVLFKLNSTKIFVGRIYKPGAGILQRWSAIEGGIETTFDETPWAAAHRKLAEEVGLKHPLFIASLAEPMTYTFNGHPRYGRKSLSKRVEDTLQSTKALDLYVPDTTTALNINIDVLKNRPDVRIARANLLASQSDLDKAEAELWPQISLSSFFGIQRTSDGVPVAGNPIWPLASSIALPVLNFGHLRSLVNAANERSKIASLTYENTVLAAVQETRTALSNYLSGVNAMNPPERSADA